jgi:hypothetical protein
MLQLETLVSAVGVGGHGPYHGWWLILAIAVFAMITPLAYLIGRNGGQPDRH